MRGCLLEHHPDRAFTDLRGILTGSSHGLHPLSERALRLTRYDSLRRTHQSWATCVLRVRRWSMHTSHNRAVWRVSGRAACDRPGVATAEERGGRLPSSLAVVERRKHIGRVKGQPLEPRVAVGQRQARVLAVSNSCPKRVYKSRTTVVTASPARFDAAGCEWSAASGVYAAVLR